MKKLDQFILKSFIGPFFAILAIVIFIMPLSATVSRVFPLLDRWSYTITPYIIPVLSAMPLATLLSSMMTFGALGENYELTAMKAAGISLARILAPVIIASALISIAAFFINDRLVPYSINQIYTMRDDIGRTKSEIKIPEGTFYDGIEGYILRIDARDDKTGMMYGVMVYDHLSNKGNTRLTVADSGMMKMRDQLSGDQYPQIPRHHPGPAEDPLLPPGTGDPAGELLVPALRFRPLRRTGPLHVQ